MEAFFMVSCKSKEISKKPKVPRSEYIASQLYPAVSLLPLTYYWKRSSYSFRGKIISEKNILVTSIFNTDKGLLIKISVSWQYSDNFPSTNTYYMNKNCQNSVWYFRKPMQSTDKL